MPGKREKRKEKRTSLVFPLVRNSFSPINRENLEDDSSMVCLSTE